MALSQTEFSFKGNSLRELIDALLREYDIGNPLLDQCELRFYVRGAINGRFSHLVGGWDVAIHDGATVVFIYSCVPAFWRNGRFPTAPSAGLYPEGRMVISRSTSQDKPTEITLRLAGDFRRRLGMHQARFAFPGNTLRRLLVALVREFDLDDLLMTGDEPRPYVQVVINGRFSYLVGGLEAEIPDGSTVVLYACGGVLTPVPLPPGTTLKDLKPRPQRE